MEYPWYEVIDTVNDITQGDIIKECPVAILSDYIGEEENQIIKAEVSIINGIILTQACDIANKKVENIILCAITSKGDFEEQQRKLGLGEGKIKSRIESIRKGQQNAYHIINNYITDDFSQDYYIINFKDIFSIPIDLAQKIALKNGKRLRLCPPYREHLSQAFARYFMRVGLPINITF